MLPDILYRKRNAIVALSARSHYACVCVCVSVSASVFYAMRARADFGIICIVRLFVIR